MRALLAADDGGCGSARGPARREKGAIVARRKTNGFVTLATRRRQRRAAYQASCASASSAPSGRICLTPRTGPGCSLITPPPGADLRAATDARSRISRGAGAKRSRATAPSIVRRTVRALVASPAVKRLRFPGTATWRSRSTSGLLRWTLCGNQPVVGSDGRHRHGRSSRRVEVPMARARRPIQHFGHLDFHTGWTRAPSTGAAACPAGEEGWNGLSWTPTASSRHLGFNRAETGRAAGAAPLGTSGAPPPPRKNWGGE